jgi:hypothetical protein
MGVMSFDNDRATGGKSRGSVAPGNRKGQREVARAEDHYRSERLQQRSHVRLWKRLTCGIALIDPRIDPGTLLDKVGEKPQLVAGPGRLRLNPRCREARLGCRPLGQLISERLNVCRNLAQEARFLAAIERSVSMKCPVSQLRCPIDLFGCRGVIDRQQLLTGGRIDALKVFASGYIDLFEADY